jgi:hypothetical protein
MRGKTKTDSFPFAQLKFIASSPDHVGDGYQRLTDALGYLLRYPARIACT